MLLHIIRSALLVSCKNGCILAMWRFYKLWVTTLDCVQALCPSLFLSFVSLNVLRGNNNHVCIETEEVDEMIDCKMFISFCDLFYCC